MLPCGDLISPSSILIWVYMKKQKKLRQTKSRRTAATSPRHLKKPAKLQYVKSFSHLFIKCCKLRMVSKIMS